MSLRNPNTPRRSNRIATSRAGSVVSAKTGASVRTAATNATNSAQPRSVAKMKELKARGSTAYGSGGRIAAAEQLSINNSGFAEAFQSQVAGAIARDDSPESQHNDANSDSGDDSGDDSDYQSTDGEDESNDLHLMSGALNGGDGNTTVNNTSGTTTTGNDTSKSFGLNHEGGLQDFPPVDRNAPWPLGLGSPPHEQPSPEITANRPVNTYQSMDDIPGIVRSRLQREVPPQPQPQPSRHAPQVQEQPIPQPNEETRFIPRVNPNTNWFKKILILGGILVGGVAVIATFQSSQSSAYSTPSFTDVIGARVDYSVNVVKHWISPPPWPTPQPGETMWGRIIKNEARLMKNEEEVVDIKSNVGDIKSSFGRLLDGKLPQYVVLRRDQKGNIDIPDDVWKSIANRFRAEGTGNAGKVAWDDFIQNNEAKFTELFGKSIDVTNSQFVPHIVHHKEFVRMLEENYERMSERLLKVIKKTVKEGQKVSTDQIRLESLALSNLAHNMELTLSKANYFSSGLGAHIDPEHTSVTMNRPRNYLQRLAFTPARRLPPIAALQPWEEPGDCWCAAPDTMKSGQAQLGVNIPYPMFPSQVTIEHIPKAMVPRKNISNAPRDIELWVESDAPANYHFDRNKNACGDGGPKGYICLGKFTYDIHGSNYLQTFDLGAQSTVPIKKAVVRVLNNWGADHTCLYRVRLHGHEQEDDYEYN